MIPLIPASGKRDAFLSGTLRFEDGVPVCDGTCGLKEKLTEVHAQTQTDDVIAIVDTDGFRERFLNCEIVKEIRIRGRDIWFVTYISDIDDVISALTGSFSGLGIPLHTADIDVLTEAYGLSECVFPAAFMKGGREISSGMVRSDIIVSMRNAGFGRVLFIDTDSATAECVQTDPETISDI